ncbi:MAG TPA: hypothetical protein VGK44_07930 [Casimicrobiaceae bacterium]|jgi:hypothetical protein
MVDGHGSNETSGYYAFVMRALRNSLIGGLLLVALSRTGCPTGAKKAPL